ncbi:MAG: GAF domain-containing protein, partial [Cyanobacteria bacterium J06641_5]
MNPVDSVDFSDPIAADRHLEPPRLGARVQPHGILLVLDEPSLEILQVSNNTQALLGRTPDRLLGQTFDSLLDPFQSDRLKAGLKENNLDYINPSKIWIRKQGDDYAIFDCIFHRNANGMLICELEPTVSQESIPFLSFYHLAKASIERLQSGQTLSDYCQTIVHEIRRVTAYDRVMLYKFDERDRGVVLAEEKLDSMESYLGLHFPESDIPGPAREMLHSNWIRTIVDASAQAVDLVSGTEAAGARSLDLTHSILRSASDCHVEYLHNMGVGASLTISLIAENKLWGIIACHHQTPKYVPYELRKACEFLGRVIFAEISSREETADYDYRMHLNHVSSVLVDAMAQADIFTEGLVHGSPNILDLAAASGAAICFGNTITTIGKTPSREDLQHLVQWLAHNVHNEAVVNTSLW